MKFKCPMCKRTQEYDEEKTLVFCSGCLTEMKEMKNGDKGRN